MKITSLLRLTMLLVAAFLVSGCAIATRIPANRFDSPEAQGKLWKGEVAGGLEGGNQYVICPDDTMTPPDFSHPGFEHSTIDPFVDANVGILSQLDVGLKIRDNSATLFQVKYQILGEPRLEAKPGNIAFAVTAAIGGSSNSSSDSDGFGVNSSNTISDTTFDFGAIAGYRVLENLLFYVGGSWTHQSYSGNLSQSVNSNPATTYAYAGRLKQTGFDIGAETGTKHFLARLEYAGAFTSSYETGFSAFGSYFGGEFGFKW